MPKKQQRLSGREIIEMMIRTAIEGDKSRFRNMQTGANPSDREMFEMGQSLAKPEMEFAFQCSGCGELCDAEDAMMCFGGCGGFTCAACTTDDDVDDGRPCSHQRQTQ